MAIKSWRYWNLKPGLKLRRLAVCCMCDCIHPLMHSGSLWAHQSEINIYTTRNLRWVPAWLIHAIRLTEKNDISLKLVANANAYQMAPVTTFTGSNIPDSTAFSERDQLRLANVHYRSLYESVPGVEIHSKDFRIFLGFWTAHSGLTGLAIM